MQEQEDSNEVESRLGQIKKPGDGGNARRCLKALAYKSWKLQQKRYCSNICQILTPLICILFTILTKAIMESTVSDQIFNIQYPLPFDMPPVTKLLTSLPNDKFPINITCQQSYLYQLAPTQQKTQVDRFFQRMLQKRCVSSDFNGLTPQFRHYQSVNKEILKIIDLADKEPFERNQDLKTDIPDGAIKFHSLNQSTLNISFAINDFRLPEYHKNNGVTKVTLPKSDGSEARITGYLSVSEGAMSLSQKISRSFLQGINEKEIIFGNRLYFPFNGVDVALKDKVLNIMGAGLYPLGLALLLPLFLYAVVSEKEDRLIEIMKMNGLNVKYYWVNFFLFNFMISMFTFSTFYFFGRFGVGLSLFKDTSWTVIWTILIGWAIAQISLTSFVQVFLSDAKSATIVGYLLSTFSTISGQPISILVYAYPTPLPWYLMAYPPMTLVRALGMISFACSNDSCYRGLLQIDGQLIKCIGVLYGWVIMFLVSIWLNDIVQQDYGVAHRPWIIELIHRRVCRNICCKCCIQTYQGENIISESEMVSMDDGSALPMDQHIKIDQSVHNEAQHISGMTISYLPLISKNLTKKYNTFSTADEDYIALKPINIGLRNKQILGLLGPNGAGKTTFISVLTGMYPQTAGNAWINGLEVGYSTTNKYIGVCPQFDLLWPDLTVYEHLKFYAYLKEVAGEQMETEIERFITDFDLNQWANTPSKELSGGMKRRLSIANSLMGNPSVVFLDEPSSGLDPGHRRALWNILLKCKRETSILLTTHLMEEAEVLCDRVGIIDKGSLKCVGSIHDLKQKFGRGYRLTINFSHDDETMGLSPVKQNPLIKKIITKFEAIPINELKSRVILKIQKTQVFDCVRMLKQEKGVSWLVSQPSLYDVFVDFVK